MREIEFGRERTPKGDGGETGIVKQGEGMMTQSKRCTVNVTEGLLRIGRSIVQLEDVSFWCHIFYEPQI